MITRVDVETCGLIFDRSTRPESRLSRGSLARLADDYTERFADWTHSACLYGITMGSLTTSFARCFGITRQPSSVLPSAERVLDDWHTCIAMSNYRIPVRHVSPIHKGAGSQRSYIVFEFLCTS